MNQRNILIVILVLIVGLTAFFFFSKGKSGKTAWVDLPKVHSEFLLKKELEAKFIKTEQTRKAIVDSMEFELQVLARQINSNKGNDKKQMAVYQIKREQYVEKKEALELDNVNMQEQYNNQIMTQINQYMKDFGKQNGYEYIFGANGTGMLMYADEAKDVTTEAIEFINEKYKGKTE
jgi:outer membrane protein